MRYYGTSLAIVSLVLLGLANSYLTTGLKPIDLTRNSYFLPYEINVDEEYRLSMEKFQPVFLKFRKDQLLPNQAYILSVSYPGYYATRFHIYWVDFEENFIPTYFNQENPRFRPKDEDKLVFLTDDKGNIVDKNAFLYVDYHDVEFYHIILFMWFWMHGKEMERLNQPLDFALRLKPSLHPMNYQYEINLYIIGSVIVAVLVLFFILKKFSKFSIVRDIFKITFTPDEITKDS